MKFISSGLYPLTKYGPVKEQIVLKEREANVFCKSTIMFVTIMRSKTGVILSTHKKSCNDSFPSHLLPVFLIALGFYD